MKTFMAIWVAFLITVLCFFAALPVALATALQATSEVNAQNCGAVFSAALFTPEDILRAYEPEQPPGDATQIAADLTAASVRLGPRILDFFDANVPITLLAESAIITDPKWAPLSTLRPTSSGADSEPEGVTDTAPDMGPTSSLPPTPDGPPVTLANVLLTIRTKESDGNYTAQADKGSASGAYQFTDGTWANFRGYRRALHAPPEVQDEKAALHVAGFLARYGLQGVPVGWYYPTALTDPSWMDRVPNPEYGNRLTVREYQTQWLELYARIAGGLPTDLTAGECSAPTNGVDPTGSTVTVTSNCGQSITIDASIGTNTENLLNAACAEGVVLGGGGWRSNAEQIALRRAHCGPTDYDIYQKPSGQCKPPTATPGNSQHERGLAIDFTQNGRALTRATSGFRWLAINARRYGLFNLPSEPWHWSTTGR
jgi:hypothetical protein